MAVDTSRIDRRFDVLRQKVEQDAGAAQEQAQEGLARKAVAQGAGASGAFMKAGAQQDKAIAAQKQSALNDVNSQKETAIGQAEDVQANRDFAKSEREAGQAFAANQADQQRRQEYGMFKENQAFTSSEAALQRGFSADMFNKDLDFKKQVQSASEDQFAKQFNQSLDQFDYDKTVSDFNMKMAQAQFDKQTLTEQLLGGGGLGKAAGKKVSDLTGVSQGTLGAGFGGGGI